MTRTTTTRARCRYCGTRVPIFGQLCTSCAAFNTTCECGMRYDPAASKCCPLCGAGNENGEQS
jgi:hypothetical protein